MAGTAIADLHARLTADVTQYNAEMNKAAAVTRSATGNIDSEFEKLQNKMAKKFSLSKIGEKILKGAGFGSGYAAINMLVEKVVAPWQQAAELAKMTEESTQRQLGYTEEIIKLRQTDAQREQYVTQQMERTYRQLADAKKDTVQFDATSPSTWWDSFKAWVADTNHTEEQTKKINELTEAVGKLGVELETINKKKRELAKTVAATAVTQTQQQTQRQTALNLEMYEVDNGKFAKGVTDHRRKLIDNLSDQVNLFDKQLSEMPISKMITPEQQLQRAEVVKKYNESLAELLPLLREEKKLGFDIGEAFASSFEDAVLGAKNLSEALRGLAQDVLRLIFRDMVSQPLASGIGSVLNKLMGRAEGGPVAENVPHIVGEKGPELFVPSSAGRIIPNNVATARGSASGPSVVVNLTTNFASGVTRQELSALLPRIVDAAKNAVADGVNRGGGYRRAFA